MLHEAAVLFQGDSGGPLTCTKDGSAQGAASLGDGQVLAGVSSTGGKLCGGAPSVYASVPYFRQWIDSTINAYRGQSATGALCWLTRKGSLIKIKDSGASISLNEDSSALYACASVTD